MTTLLLAFGAMLTIVAAMAVGVMFGRAPIKGSCGGMGAVGIDAECEICGGNPARCESATQGDAPRPEENAGLGYDAAPRENSWTLNRLSSAAAGCS